jgi:hypothetical protein
MNKIKYFINNLITEPNNSTPCPIRIAGILALGEWLVISPMHFIQTHTFDPVAFGTGFGATIAAVGIALGTKKDSPIKGE